MSETDAAGNGSGSCLCGAARFNVTGLTNDVHACHCPFCQKWCAGPFVGIEVKTLDFEDENAITVYRSSEWAERIFCKTCGTNLAWRLQDDSMPMISLTALSTAPANAKLSLEYFVDAKPAAYALAGDHKRLTREETEKLFGGTPY